jgi:hypothetical protein
MTESQDTIADDRTHLLHLSNISFIPADVVSVYWEMNQEFSKKLVTRIRTRYEVFVLESDLPNYQDDIQALKKALDRQ